MEPVCILPETVAGARPEAAPAPEIAGTMNRPWNGFSPTAAAAVTAAVLTAAVLLLHHGNWLQRWNWLTYDTFLKYDFQPAPADIIIIAIDQRSLAALGRWPWSRQTHAGLLNVLSRSRPAAIGFDLLFAEPDPEDPAGDTAFVDAVRASGRIVLPVAAEQAVAGGDLMETLPFPQLAAAAARLGHIDLELEPDSQARYIFLKAGIRQADWPHFSLALLQLAEAEIDWLDRTPAMRSDYNSPGSRPVWVRDHMVGIPYTGPPGHFQRRSYVDVLRGAVPPTVFDGRILLIGATATGLGDALPTPLSGGSTPMPGVEIVAQALQGLRTGRMLRPLDTQTQLILDACLVLFIGLFSHLLVNGGRRLTALALVPAPLLLSILLFFVFRRWYEPLPSLLILALAHPVWQWQDLRRLTSFVRKEHRRAATTHQMLAEAVLSVKADNTIAYLNPAAESLTGWSLAEAVGKPCGQVLGARDDSRHRPLCDALRRINFGELTKYWTLSMRSGEKKIVRASFARLDESRRDQDIVITLSDVTLERRLKEQIRYQATHDLLTGLSNRAMLHERLKLSDRPLAALVINLDDFRKINDSLGHMAGDALLRTVAGQLREKVSPEHTVARLGGDEFVILVEKPRDRGAVRALAGELARSVRKPQTILGHELFVTASIGISIFPGDGKSSGDLLRNADIAMNRAKNNGGNAIVVFEQAMNELAMERFILENDLQRALAQGEFRLLYQPIIDLASGSVVGAEALIRWQHPRRGLLGPDEFIGCAEKNGLIVPVGEWVIRQACADLAAWLPQCGERFRVAVNLSPRQLQDDRLPDMVTGALRKFGLNPDHLELEITEEVFMADRVGELTTLRRLRDLGLKIAIDDFGTGYSSFGYLKHLDVSRLKIDKSFVKDLTAGSSDAAIVQAIISMAGLLRMKLTAEGVETAEQALFFRQHGSIESQGFYFAEPMAAGKLERLLAGTDPVPGVDLVFPSSGDSMPDSPDWPDLPASLRDN